MCYYLRTGSSHCKKGSGCYFERNHIAEVYQQLLQDVVTLLYGQEDIFCELQEDIFCKENLLGYDEEKLKLGSPFGGFFLIFESEMFFL